MRLMKKWYSANPGGRMACHLIVNITPRRGHRFHHQARLASALFFNLITSSSAVASCSYLQPFKHSLHTMYGETENGGEGRSSLGLFRSY
jgi:hypothetical protein